MNVRKFVANDARIALKKVKETLGDDAVILSNRTVDGQVEIMAVASRDMAMIVTTPGRDQHVPAGDRLRGLQEDRVSLSRSAMPNAESAAKAASAARPSPQLAKIQEARRTDSPVAAAAATATPSAGHVRQPFAPVTAGASQTAATAEMSSALMDELRALRRVVEHHMAGYAWGEHSREQPARAELLRVLLDAGFSPRLADQWLAALGPAQSLSQALTVVKAAAEKGLITLAPEGDIIERGGVFALVGPTGVGKTTTTAKLAARCVLRHGRDKVALITSDGYRIGAHEQLRIYGRILGVPVYVVKDAAELQQTLRELSIRHLVLIDTMGMSQRDRNVAEQIRMFEACSVQRLLLLSATARGDTLDDVITAYGGSALAGCVLTKIDEAVSLAPAIDAVIRHRLHVAFVCNGQRVPEDLHLPNRAYLIHRAFKETAESSAHRSSGIEPALAMAAAGYFPNSQRHV